MNRELINAEEKQKRINQEMWMGKNKMKMSCWMLKKKHMMLSKHMRWQERQHGNEAEKLKTP